MKKGILLFILLASGFGPAWAKSSKVEAVTDPTADSNPFYIGIGTGADLPGSNWDSDYYVGGGANVFGGYQLDKDLAAQVDVEEWFFTGGGSQLYNLRVLAEAKYTFEGQGWQPYLLAGPGMVLQNLSPSGDSTTNFDALGGLGVQFDLAPKAHFFLEAKYNFIMSQTSTFTDLPVSTGLWVGL